MRRDVGERAGSGRMPGFADMNLIPFERRPRTDVTVEKGAA
jgi:hypothetical protein